MEDFLSVDSLKKFADLLGSPNGRPDSDDEDEKVCAVLLLVLSVHSYATPSLSTFTRRTLN